MCNHGDFPPYDVPLDQTFTQCGYESCTAYSGLETFCPDHQTCTCGLPMAHDGRCPCTPECVAEGRRGLDCHECGHSLNCPWCCTNYCPDCTRPVDDHDLRSMSDPCFQKETDMSASITPYFALRDDRDPDWPASIHAYTDAERWPNRLAITVDDGSASTKVLTRDQATELVRALNAWLTQTPTA